jgi:LPXTG-motif cell wall-anchored protein
MNRLRIVLAAVTLALVAQTLMADQWSKKTKVTFSAPVSVPGAVLPAGSYIFRLNDSNANRHIVQVQNVRGDKTYATILAIPDYRLNASSKTVMYFGERAAGSPVAIKSWFYPGDNFGQRFVYPKKKAQEIATTYHQPVPAAEAPQPAAAPQAEVKVVTPEKTETAYAPATFEKHDAQDTAGQDGEAVKEQPVQQAETPAPRKLPKTGSPFPMMGGLGLLALAGSGVFRYVGSRLR